MEWGLDNGSGEGFGVHLRMMGNPEGVLMVGMKMRNPGRRLRQLCKLQKKACLCGLGLGQC